MIPAGIPRWFTLVGLLLGALYALFMGPLRVPDEAGHMYRSYLVSSGVCTGVPAIGAPVDYSRDLDHLVPWTPVPPGSTGRDLLKLVDPAHGRPLAVVSLFYAVNLYNCLPYLPAGAAFRIARSFNASPLTWMYAGRIANLIAYLILVIAAMRLLPDFQLPLAILALMPMSLHQAASLAADGVTTGLAFVLIAYILHLALGRPRPLTRREYLLLALGMFLAGLSKSNAGLVFLLVLIPAARFPNRQIRWLTIAGLFVLAYGTAAVWQMINQPNGEVYATLKTAASVDLDANAAAIFQRPFYFLTHVLHTLEWKTSNFLEQFVGILGWLSIRLPAWAITGYLLLLAAVSTTAPAIPRTRLVLLAVFALNIASLLVAFWITETPHPLPDRYAIVIYGRYLIPFAPLAMLALAGLAPRMRLDKIAFAFAMLVNLIALHIVWNTYHGHTSTLPNRLRMAALHFNFSDAPGTAPQRYEDLIVRRPGDGVEDTKIYLIQGNKRHWILNGEWLKNHGYAWPDDINIIPAADLAAIPEGAPILTP